MVPMPSKLGRFFLLVVSGKILRANEKNKQNKWCTRGAALSGTKILADFDGVISERAGYTGLRCLIITNVAYLQRTLLVTIWNESVSYTHLWCHNISYSCVGALGLQHCRENVQHNHMNSSLKKDAWSYCFNKKDGHRQFTSLSVNRLRGFRMVCWWLLVY